MDAIENKFKVLGKVKAIKGSILNPETGGLRFILSPWNLAGLTIKNGEPTNPQSIIFDKKWSQLKKDTKSWYARRVNHKLGEILETAVQSDVWVIHLLCQKEDMSFDIPAIETCLNKLTKLAKFEKATLHVSNLFLAQVPQLKDLLLKHCVAQGLSLYCYEEA